MKLSDIPVTENTKDTESKSEVNIIGILVSTGWEVLNLCGKYCNHIINCFNYTMNKKYGKVCV